MRWYHVLVAGMTVMLLLTVSAAFYVAADRESGGGRKATTPGTKISQAVPASATPAVTVAESAARGESGAHAEGGCDGADDPALDPCHHCGGCGEVPCGICGGDGMAEVDCADCGGSGCEPCEGGG